MMNEFELILQAHRERYPRMEPQDYGKLAFQSEFGPEHLVRDADSVLTWLKKEWRELPEGSPVLPPDFISNGLCRFHLSACTEEQLPRLAELFCRSAAEHKGSRDGLETRLAVLERLDVPGLEQWLTEYRAVGCPAVHHSNAFREAYEPHYRVLRTEYAAMLWDTL